MPGATSPWRVNDVVAYDGMRDAAVTAFAVLRAIALTNTPEADRARDELVELSRAVKTVDAFDRVAVAAVAARVADVLQRFQNRQP